MTNFPLDKVQEIGSKRHPHKWLLVNFAASEAYHQCRQKKETEWEEELEKELIANVVLAVMDAAFPFVKDPPSPEEEKATKQAIIVGWYKNANVEERQEYLRHVIGEVTLERSFEDLHEEDQEIVFEALKNHQFRFVHSFWEIDLPKEA